MKKIVIAGLSLLAFSISSTRQADAAIYGGHIRSYFLSGPTNLPFRVYLDSDTPACPEQLFYISLDNPNYQAYVSGLLTAYSLHKNVLLTYTAGAGGYCQILEYQVVD